MSIEREMAEVAAGLKNVEQRLVEEKDDRQRDLEEVRGSQKEDHDELTELCVQMKTLLAKGNGSDHDQILKVNERLNQIRKEMDERAPLVDRFKTLETNHDLLRKEYDAAKAEEKKAALFRRLTWKEVLLALVGIVGTAFVGALAAKLIH